MDDVKVVVNPVARVLSRLVAHLLPTTYFLVAVSFYLKTYDSAQIKITLTQMGCSLVAVLWVIQLILEQRWPFKRESLKTLLPFIAVLASGVVSFLHSNFMLGSLDEFLRRVFYVLMAVVVLADFRSWDRHARLMKWLFAAFIVTVGYGMVQYLDSRLFPPGPMGGLDPFVWRQAFGARVFSTFGNPNFYGNFLVIVTPFILAFYLRSGGQIFRPYLVMGALVGLVYATDRYFLGFFGGVNGVTRLWVMLGLLGAMAVLLALVWWKTPTARTAGLLFLWSALFINVYSTETKGAWVGFVAALVYVSLLVGYFFMSGAYRALGRKLVYVTLGIGLLGAGVVGYYAKQRMQSVSFRVFTWIATWDMFREQPILGSGIGTFKWTYPAYRRPEIILLEGKSNTETDHAEDEYLEVLFDEGLVGFGIFLWMVLMASWMGLKGLERSTSLGRGPPFDRRAFYLLGYLGSWWGALTHWFFDVSIRFVSSGVFSFILPAAVVSLSQRDPMPETQEEPFLGERWILAGVALLWTVCLLSLGIDPWRCVAVGVLIYFLEELLEWRGPTPPVSPADPLPRAGSARPWTLWGGLAALGLLVGWGFSCRYFRNLFLADMHHNMAIFFSKQGVWSQSAEFEGQVKSFPPEIQRNYQRVGGALQNYEKVWKLNSAFPMAPYFIGNVYSDWGSGAFAQSLQARQKNDLATAATLEKKADTFWNEALKFYDQVKGFAPNYVQTHHQVGMIYLKMGDVQYQQGRSAEAQRFYAEALKHFRLYEMLDPVFPVNFYRMAYIYQKLGDYDQAETAFKGALIHNSTNVVGRYYADRNVETYSNLAKLMAVKWLSVNGEGKSVLPRDASYERAERYYLLALAETARLDNVDEVDRWVKTLSQELSKLYLKADQQVKAVELFSHLQRGIIPSVSQINPDIATPTHPSPN